MNENIQHDQLPQTALNDNDNGFMNEVKMNANIK